GFWLSGVVLAAARTATRTLRARSVPIQPVWRRAPTTAVFQLSYLRGLLPARGIRLRDQPFQLNHQLFQPLCRCVRLRYRKPHHGKPSRERLPRGIAACESHPKPPLVETRQVIRDKSDEQ